MTIPSEAASGRAKVILRHCDTYDAERIGTIVGDGMDVLGLRPFGRTLVKPNLVATGELFAHAYTRPEVVEGVVLAMKARARDDIEEIAIGERCGITVPTRTAFEGADYPAMVKRQGVRSYYFEEEPQVEIPLRHEGRLRDYVFTPEPVARADFFVNCPKFKAHPWTTVTFSLKNYIGIQDDRHRLIDHDHRLDEKIADLQHIVQPQLIVVDGITAGEGRMLTPIPFALNLVIMGNNQVAVDAVCCRIIGVEPMDVAHIRLAHEQGFGPTDLGDIDILGDVSLEGARERGNGFEVGLVRVEKYFEGTKIKAYAGPPPEPERTDYCWGGCPGALEEAIEILRLYDERCDEKMPPLHIVFGAYRGPIDAKAGERVIFLGDCANWQGAIDGELVQIQSRYRDRSTKDPHHAKHDDIFAKLLGVVGKKLRSGSKRHVRIDGCPVSVAEQVLLLVQEAGLNNPYLDGREAQRFGRGYLAWRARTALDRLRGRAYQNPGVAQRGAAQPSPSPIGAVRPPDDAAAE